MTAEAPWYTDAERLARVIDAVRAVQPGLVLHQGDATPVLRGEFLVREGEEVLDRYTIEIELAWESEQGLATVREVGGRIPRTEDRHVSHDGSACVMQPAAYWFHRPQGVPLAEFLEGPVRSHLAMQSIVEGGEGWPIGEWAHGGEGVAEFFAEVLGITAPRAVCELVGAIAGERIKGHWPCPCGSGRKFRKCHGQVVFKAQRNIPLNVRLQSYSMLRTIAGNNGKASSNA